MWRHTCDSTSPPSSDNSVTFTPVQMSNNCHPREELDKCLFLISEDMQQSIQSWARLHMLSQPPPQAVVDLLVMRELLCSEARSVTFSLVHSCFSSISISAGRHQQHRHDWRTKEKLCERLWGVDRRRERLYTQEVEGRKKQIVSPAYWNSIWIEN